MGSLKVEPAEGNLGAACACCAGEPGLRGFVYEDETARAVYFVEPLGIPNFPLIKLGVAVGEWGAGSPQASRAAFALLCKPTPNGPSLEPTEPKMAGFPELAMLGARIAAADLDRHPRLSDFHAIARAVIDQDWRLDAIRSSAGSPVARRRFSADPA